MMKEMILATGNEHKAREFREMLPGVRILTLKDLSTPISIVEDGTTFEENALIKARAVHEATGMAALADDSGIEVDALGGKPGVHSDRWMGEDTPYDIKNAKLMELTRGKDRTARYVCAIAFVDEEGKEYVCRGTVEGEIARAPEGTGGFGYDPVFFYPPFGTTLANVTEEQKHEVSHRGNALKQFLRDMGDRL